tara:strand:- start:241 stop:579 length:339 start_codon:yes stop_codon:yes gene_type:complete
MDDETKRLTLIIKTLSQQVDVLANDAWIYEASAEEVEAVDRILKIAREVEKKYNMTPPRPILEGNENRGGINVKPSEKFITRPAPPTGYRPSESVQPIASAPKSPPPPKPTR